MSESRGEFKVAHSRYFAAQLEKVRKRAGSSAFHARVLEELELACRHLTQRDTALAPISIVEKRAFDLTGVRRFKGHVRTPWRKGLRFFYLVCEQTARVIVLEYGERNTGRPDDAYALFGARLKSGYFDPYFRLLKQTHAYWQIPPTAAEAAKRDSEDAGA